MHNKPATCHFFCCYEYHLFATWIWRTAYILFHLIQALDYQPSSPALCWGIRFSVCTPWGRRLRLWSKSWLMLLNRFNSTSKESKSCCKTSHESHWKPGLKFVTWKFWSLKWERSWLWAIVKADFSLSGPLASRKPLVLWSSDPTSCNSQHAIPLCSEWENPTISQRFDSIISCWTSKARCRESGGGYGRLLGTKGSKL